MNTSRLKLRPVVLSDLDNIFLGLSDPLVIKYYGVSYETKEKTKEQMQWYENLVKEKKGIWWAIENIDSHEFYGAIGYNDWDHTHRKAEIGVWFLPKYWGRGFMKEAMEITLKYGFETMNLHRVEAYVREENTVCKKGLNKLNFTREGIFREAELLKDEFISYEIFSILKHER